MINKFVTKKIKQIIAIKNKILLSFLVFFIFMLIGYFVVYIFPNKNAEINNLITKAIPKDVYNSLNSVNKFLLIFIKNVFATTIVILGGLLTLGVSSILGMAVNGFIIGFVISMLHINNNLNPMKVFIIGIMPHGIFELTALFISCALGLNIATHIVKIIKSKNNKIEQKNKIKNPVLISKLKAFYNKVYLINRINIKQLIKKGIYYYKTNYLIYLQIVVPLLFIAALIEVFVTPVLINQFL